MKSQIIPIMSYRTKVRPTQSFKIWRSQKYTHSKFANTFMVTETHTVGTIERQRIAHQKFFPFIRKKSPTFLCGVVFFDCVTERDAHVRILIDAMNAWTKSSMKTNSGNVRMQTDTRCHIWNTLSDFRSTLAHRHKYPLQWIAPESFYSEIGRFPISSELYIINEAGEYELNTLLIAKNRNRR